MDPATTPTIIPRDQHEISRANISPNALKVLYRLNGAGYEAYLVGGGVRDLLLGREPKDFDIATDASPEEVRKVFRNCRLIGRRFRLAHVHFGREIIEVATFRGGMEVDAEEGDEEDEVGSSGDRVVENGMILRDNTYGSMEEDAFRRDFTVNSLYYTTRDFSVVDYTGGLADLKAGRLRLIGDPWQRYREDPVRMLRAVRFAAKLGFRIDPDCEEPIFELGHLLAQVPSARLFEEVLKIFLGGSAVAGYELLRHYGLFGHLFPATEAALAIEEQHFPRTFVLRALENTDLRVAEDKPVTPAFLFGALLWEPTRLLAAEVLASGECGSELHALQLAGEEVTRRQVERVALPKRFSLPMREIWDMQARLPRRSGKRALVLASHPRFRAAYDFLLLRNESGESLQELCDWWTAFQENDDNGRVALLRSAERSGEADPEKRRRRRRGGRRRSGKAAPSAAE